MWCNFWQYFPSCSFQAREGWWQQQSPHFCLILPGEFTSHPTISSMFMLALGLKSDFAWKAGLCLSYCCESPLRGFGSPRVYASTEDFTSLVDPADHRPVSMNAEVAKVCPVLLGIISVGNPEDPM